MRIIRMSIANDIFNNTTELLKTLLKNNVLIDDLNDIIKMVAHDLLETEYGYNGFQFHHDGILLFSTLKNNNIEVDFRELKKTLYGFFNGNNPRIINGFDTHYNDLQTLFMISGVIDENNLSKYPFFVNDNFVCYNIKIKSMKCKLHFNGCNTNEQLTIDIQQPNNLKFELQKELIRVTENKYYKLDNDTYYTMNYNSEPVLIHISFNLEL